MARCMLCSSPVGDGDAVCPHCGGAVEADHVHGGPFAVPDPTAVQAGVDPTTVDGGAAPLGPGATLGPPPGYDAGPFGTGGSGSWSPPAPAPAAPAPAPVPPGPYGGAPGYGGGPYGTQPYGGNPYAGAPGYAAPGYGAPYGTPYGGPPGYGYGGSGPYPVPYPSPYPYVPPKPTDGLAIASLITAIVGLVFSFGCYVPILACPVGAVLGHVALRRIAQTGNQGRGLALAGIIVGWLGTGLLLLVIGLIVAVGIGGA